MFTFGFIRHFACISPIIFHIRSIRTGNDLLLRLRAECSAHNLRNEAIELPFLVQHIANCTINLVKVLLVYAKIVRDRQVDDDSFGFTHSGSKFGEFRLS